MQFDSYHYKCLWTSYTSQMLHGDKSVVIRPWYLDHMHGSENNTCLLSSSEEAGLH